MTTYGHFARSLRLRRLYRHSTAGLMITPLDHSISDGPVVPKGTTLDQLAGRLAAGGSDAVVVHKGSVRHISPERFAAMSLIIHLNASTSQALDPNAKYLVDRGRGGAAARRGRGERPRQPRLRRRAAADRRPRPDRRRLRPLEPAAARHGVPARPADHRPAGPGPGRARRHRGRRPGRGPGQDRLPRLDRGDARPDRGLPGAGPRRGRTRAADRGGRARRTSATPWPAARAGWRWAATSSRPPTRGGSRPRSPGWSTTSPNSTSALTGSRPPTGWTSG